MRIVFLFIIAITGLAQAESFTFGASEDQRIPANCWEILQEGIDTVSFERAVRAPQWRKLKSESMLLPQDGSYWLRFSLTNKSKHNHWIIEFPDFHTSSLQLFILKGQNQATSFKPIGFEHIFENRSYDHKNFFFDTGLNPGESATYYVHVHSRYPTSFAAYVRTSSFEFTYFLREYYWLGLFYGILFIMAVYNLFLFIFTHERIYGYYVCYIVCGALYSLSEDGIGFHFFWSQFPQVNHFLFIWSPVLFLLTFIIYSLEFLNFFHPFKEVRRILWGLLAINIFLVAMSTSIPPFIRAIFYFLPFAYVYVEAWRSFLKGYVAARFFIAGFTVVLSSFIVYFLRMANILPTTLYTFYIFNIGMVLEVLILSYALGDRYRIMRDEKAAAQKKTIDHLKENERLKDKVNQELETKVTERTIQLQQKSEELKNANEQLLYLTEQLNKMNATLDKDNWELKKQVKKETRSRILQEKVSYEEYLKIYPNDHACLTFLENLKWENGYACRKCNHTNYGKGEKPFTRRCTRCKYTESVTAGTLFHGIKFPLNKAFYIVYDTYDEKSRSTIDRLAETIDLRRVTVWLFRKKVLDIYSSRPRLKNAGWESIILDDEK